MQEIGSLIGKVVKFDMQMDKGSRGQLVRFVVQINPLPLVSKIRIAGRLHRIEYKSLPSICFQCGRVGHVKDGCPQIVLDKEMDGNSGEG